MFVALYRWRVKEGHEDRFVHAWSEVTRFYLEEFGSLGSRLHKGSDGLYYGYAQWPSDEARLGAFDSRNAIGGDSLVRARATMAESTEESFPEVKLEVVSDYLQIRE